MTQSQPQDSSQTFLKMSSLGCTQEEHFIQGGTFSTLSGVSEHEAGTQSVLQSPEKQHFSPKPWQPLSVMSSQPEIAQEPPSHRRLS